MKKSQKLVSLAFQNYKAVDIAKYAAAIMVICIHCNPIASNVYLDYFMNQIICRIAVPFFFISSAFFIRKGMNSRPGYLKVYLKSLAKSYLLWSVFFIPIGIDWIHQNLTLSNHLLPFALLFGLIHVGTYYHLWYIPALILSLLLVDRLLKKISYKKIMLLSASFFLFGSLETYYGILPDGLIKKCFDITIQVFFTTRSGLLYGMIFVVIGFFIYDYQKKLESLIKYLTPLTIISGLLVFMEGMFLYSVPKLDMNFLLALVPFSFFFFLKILSLKRAPAGDTRKIRELSKYYYFTHTICVVMIEEVGKALQMPLLRSGLLSFLLIISLTHVLCLAIISVQKQPLKKSFIALGAFIGMAATFIIACLVYYYKTESIVIKFEFVPCLWIFTSIAAYSLLRQLEKHLLHNKKSQQEKFKNTSLFEV